MRKIASYENWILKLKIIPNVIYYQRNNHQFLFLHIFTLLSPRFTECSRLVECCFDLAKIIFIPSLQLPALMEFLLRPKIFQKQTSVFQQWWFLAEISVTASGCFICLLQLQINSISTTLSFRQVFPVIFSDNISSALRLADWNWGMQFRHSKDTSCWDPNLFEKADGDRGVGCRNPLTDLSSHQIWNVNHCCRGSKGRGG